METKIRCNLSRSCTEQLGPSQTLHEVTINCVPFTDKRKAWDYKGRLEDMEQSMQMMQKTSENYKSSITDNIDRINYLESINQTLDGKVELKTQQSQKV